MTAFYGSKKEPKKEFGEDTPELHAFYQAIYKLAPGPCQLLEQLINSWQPFAKVHQWILPDGFVARVKVKVGISDKIEVDELAHSTFTYEYYENKGKARDVKNAANVIHSIDAYILRSLIRRCNYEYNNVAQVSAWIQEELMSRPRKVASLKRSDEVKYYLQQYARSSVVDITIVPYLAKEDLLLMSSDYLKALNKILCSMLEHKPFEVITIHDDFKAHPNNLNAMRKHYRNILAELADSNLMQDLLRQLHNTDQGTFTKLSPDLSKYIRQSNYAIC